MKNTFIEKRRRGLDKWLKNPTIQKHLQTQRAAIGKVARGCWPGKAAS